MQVPRLEAAERGALYRLGVLIGQAPENLTAKLSQPRPILTAEADVPVGIPSDLLRRRPDLRAAERRIAAANARIGVREADLYPHFSLTGVAGYESLYANNFLTGPSRYYAIGPSMTWLVFDAGRIRDEALAERARTDLAAAEYRKTVLGALGEVEIALVTSGDQPLDIDLAFCESIIYSVNHQVASDVGWNSLELSAESARTCCTEVARSDDQPVTGGAHMADVNPLDGFQTPQRIVEAVQRLAGDAINTLHARLGKGLRHVARCGAAHA